MYRERLEILKNWKECVENVAKAAHSFFKKCEVYAFGSAVHGTLTAASDVDVLIIVESLPKGLMERAKLKGQIERMANLPTYQIHLATRDEVKRSLTYSKVAKESRGF